MPAITVLMPVYNGGVFLHDSIPSVLNQTFMDFEFLILNDGSTDNSSKIVKQYKDSRIKFIERDNDFIGTLNYGLKRAKGEYIARMDADDIMLPERLEEQYRFMENNPDIDLCGTQMQAFGNSNKLYKLCYDADELQDHMILGNPFAHPTTILRTSTIRKNRHHYKQEYKYAEDYKLWLDISQKGKITNIEKVLLRYRVSDSQISQVKKEQQQTVTRKIQEEAITARIKVLSPEIQPDIKRIKKLLNSQVSQSMLSFKTYSQIMYVIIKERKKKRI